MLKSSVISSDLQYHELITNNVSSWIFIWRHKRVAR